MRYRPRVFPLDPTLDVGALAARLRSLPGLAVLDSAGGAPRDFSWIAFDPLGELALGRELPLERELPLHACASARTRAQMLRATLARLRAEEGDAIPGPFHGGFVGALSFDLGAAGERALDVAPDPWHSPLVAGGFYCDFIVRDERAERNLLVLGEELESCTRPPLAVRLERIRKLLASASMPPSFGQRPPPHPAGAPRPLGPLVRHTPAAEHMRRIERVRDAIAAGDVYQVNLAHRLTRAMAGDPLELYLRLRQVNPAPYMAYLAFGPEHCAPRGSAGPGWPKWNGALLSASPELLFEFDGERVRTRPIKGTAPRALDPARDRELARALLASAKDRAELAMIVDLERNDVGRIARPGSVRVEAFPRLESYASVHHLTADVVGSVRAGLDAFDVLAALFPGGSISGAPKLASLALIAALEGEGRGFFTGALGFVDVRGRACFNILIRTLVWRALPGVADAGEVSFHVGGGITWSSDAELEERETWAKAAALALALEADAVAPTGGVVLPTELA